MEEKIKYISELIGKNNNNGNNGLHFLLKGESNKELVEKLRETNSPIFRGDVTSIAFEGYKGFHLEDILVKLLEYTNGDITEAQKGIVILDGFERWSINENYMEIDDNESYQKQREKFHNERIIRSGFQNNFIPYLRGCVVPVKFEGKDYLFDTSQLTFVLFGNFKEEDIQIYNLGYDTSIVSSTYDFLTNDQAEKK